MYELDWGTSVEVSTATFVDHFGFMLKVPVLLTPGYKFRTKSYIF